MRIGDLACKPRRIVYLAGRDRKPDIERALRFTGQVVETVETYEARPAAALATPVVTALRDGSVDGVLHFSRRSVTLFIDLAAKEGIKASAFRHLCFLASKALFLEFRLLGGADRGEAGFFLAPLLFAFGIALIACLDDLAMFFGAGLALRARNPLLHLLH